MKIDDLSRPIEGQRNTITLSSGIRFVKVISRRFVCPKCNIFCGELLPVIDKAVRAWMRRNKKDLFCEELQTKVYCYSGCHDHPSWGWKEFDWSSPSARDSIMAWPQEWKAKDILEAERKARIADEAHKRGERRE